MNAQSKELTPDSRIKDAAQVALKKARQFSTKMAILRDGKVELLTPDEFERGLNERR